MDVNSEAVVVKLYYYADEHGNFGDDLNLWFWDRVLPNWRQVREGDILVGVGTLLNDKLPQGRRKVVLGSGVGYGAAPDVSDPAEWDVRLVRGPQTAAALGLPPECAATDPAVLIADFNEFRDLPKRQKPIFIPHHRSDARLDWPTICARAGIDYVSPRGEAQTVISAIAAAPLVLSESMHGAIFADAFRVPWVSVRVNHLFNDFKWRDWAESVEVDLAVHSLFSELDTIARLVPRGRQPAASDGQPSPPPKTKAGHLPGRLDIRLRLRIKVESRLAVRNLRRLCKVTPQLSDGVVLETRKTRIRDVLARLAAESPAPVPGT